MCFNNVNFTDNGEIANQLNLFFTSIASKISDSINPTNDDLSVNPPNCNFNMSSSPILYSELIEALNNLQPKKSLDLNENSSFLVKQTINSYVIPLLHIFNLSISTGTVPRNFKIAKVIPIYKSGDPTDPNNYRPISLLCTFSKILEKIVFYSSY
jgi:hypothetical protein